MCQPCEDEDNDWRVDEGWSGERLAPQREAERRGQPPRATNPGPRREQLDRRRGPSRESNTPDDHREYQRRLQASYRAAGITADIAVFHGNLLYGARRKARNMSWERWQEIQNGSQNLASVAFDDILQYTLDMLRDEVLEATLGQLVVHLLGVPLDYAMAIQMIWDESRWNDRDSDARDAYRTRSMYNWLMRVLATNLWRVNGAHAGEILARLTRQALLYQEWAEHHAPAVERWAYQRFGGPQMSRAPRSLPFY